ncbi:MAG TPA: methionine--tRNA ligase subunit beta, partial [Nitrospiria bacterium]
ALREIWKTINLANKYIERNAPWTLAKDPAKVQRLNTVLYYLCETLRILSCYIYPFMPETSRRMAEEIGWRKNLDNVLLPRDLRWGGMKPGTITKKGAALFPRIEKTEEAAPPPSSSPSPSQTTERKKMEQVSEQPSLLSYADFQKLDLRSGRIITADKVAGADRLLRLEVDIGTETRQVVAGIAAKYAPDSLINKKVILVVNLKPAVIRGVESRGMILAAGDKEVEALATFEEDVDPGTRVK